MTSSGLGGGDDFFTRVRSLRYAIGAKETTGKRDEVLKGFL
jgi:hypothetical protein